MRDVHETLSAAFGPERTQQQQHWEPREQQQQQPQERQQQQEKEEQEDEEREQGTEP